MKEDVSLLELTRLMGHIITSNPGTQNVWVTAETSDVSVRGGHVYMELIEKDDQGKAIAKARSIIWQSVALRIIPNFERITGQRFASGIKVRVKASATLHPLFGLSLTIGEIDPSYTMGDLLRKRQEILDRLKKEGILEENRKLKWNSPSLRIAVISAESAAGYGDFMNHMRTSGLRFRFNTRLFPSVMQGEKAVESILLSLDRIENEVGNWDGVVIIRGGGSTSDLASFESYELAARIACYPLPVIIGIGHERDITVLDYVANMRVKTPTAAADWLIQEAERHLDYLRLLVNSVIRFAGDKINGEKVHLSYLGTTLPHIAESSFSAAIHRVEKNIMALESIGSKKVAPEKSRIENLKSTLKLILTNRISKSRETLENKSELLRILSPESTLKRGYTLTVVDGKVLKSAHEEIPGGTLVTTILHDGQITTIKQ